MADNRGVANDGDSGSLTSALQARIAAEIDAAHGWLGFDRFMELALYAPQLGYYAHTAPKFGAMPQSGSDFATAPEMTPLFGATLATQVAEALRRTGTDTVWEFGAGSGALAAQLLDSLAQQGLPDVAYSIVDISGSLQARQRERLARFGGRVRWATALPDAIDGVAIGNEVLDALPVQLLARSAGHWHERGVVRAADGFAWADRPTALRPPVDIAGDHDYLTEIHPQAEALVRTVAATLRRGAAFFIDYGFSEAEYYHPQRSGGTVMCHRAHRSDGDPLEAVGEKDITAHVNFTAMALAAQEAGCQVLGYTSQARFLFNAGLAGHLEQAGLPERSRAHRLVAEHEMGELFKVLGFARGEGWDAIGFAQGDRSHRL